MSPMHEPTLFDGERHAGWTAGSTASYVYLSGIAAIGSNGESGAIPKGAAVSLKGITGSMIQVVAGTYGSTLTPGSNTFNQLDRFKVVAIACVTLAGSGGTGLILLEGRTSLGLVRAPTVNAAVMGLSTHAGVMIEVNAASYGLHRGFAIHMGATYAAGSDVLREVMILPWRI